MCIYIYILYDVYIYMMYEFILQWLSMIAFYDIVWDHLQWHNSSGGTGMLYQCNALTCIEQRKIYSMVYDLLQVESTWSNLPLSYKYASPMAEPNTDNKRQTK